MEHSEPLRVNEKLFTDLHGLVSRTVTFRVPDETLSRVGIVVGVNTNLLVIRPERTFTNPVPGFLKVGVECLHKVEDCWEVTS